VPIPHKPHHKLCIKNKTTRGRGELTQQQLAIDKEEVHLQQLCSASLQPHEKASSCNMNQQAVNTFLDPRKKKESLMDVPTAPTAEKSQLLDNQAMIEILCGAAATACADVAFCKKPERKGAPLAMTAVAEAVMEKIAQPKSKVVFNRFFHDLTVVTPPCKKNNNPHCHLIVGQKLLLADWSHTHGIQPSCPERCCDGRLQNQRSNFSKNKTLFPVFSIDGPPAWCVIKSLVCDKCHSRFDANESSVLLTLPVCAEQTCPVETKFALPDKHCHSNGNATAVFDSVMVACANGELCSRLLFNAINRACI